MDLLIGISDLILAKISPFFPFFVVAMVFFVALPAMVIIYPLVFPHFCLRLLLHVCFAIFLLFNVLWNFAICHRSRKWNNVPKADPERPTPPADDCVPVDPKTGEGFDPLCRRCGIRKPLRAHHCRQCGGCIRKMDHHCPWIAGCVGEANMRFFVLFMVYLYIGALYVVVMALPVVRSNWNSVDGSIELVLVLVIFATATAITLALTPLLGMQHRLASLWASLWAPPPCACATRKTIIGWLPVPGWSQLYLCATNQTTIEFYANIERRKRIPGYRNPYDRGVAANLREAFSMGRRNVLAWFLPAFPQRPGPALYESPALYEGEGPTPTTDMGLPARQAPPAPLTGRVCDSN
ncbi:putative DHHC zinc finger domain [Paratrimastix pyriformis]|uniref:Palmitoyltransferase n=1 Tax=Paratrimastix pyriformis TaxID=342808 RepID=A0ABQ8UUJ4_9EUKA|nr:putative DHHC zinc finger domain [Paratrimastix pyriformis]